MKKLVFLLAVLAIVFYANAQKILEKEAPYVVKSALQKNYPQLNEQKREKPKAHYEAKLERRAMEYSVLIDNAGNMFETDVPVHAKTYIAKNYVGQKIKETAKIVDAKDVFTSEVERKDLIFDSSGKFIKETND